MKNQKDEKEKLLAESVIANKELAFQNEEKEKRAAELVIANEKAKQSEELIIKNKELTSSRIAAINMMEDAVEAKNNLEVANLELKAQIEDRMRAEKSLIESEENYRSLVDNALVGVYKITLDGDIIFTNAAFLKIIEYDGDDITKLNIKRFYNNPDNRNKLVEIIQEHGDLNNFETELISFKGKPINILINRKLEGNLLVGMMLDITERKQAEEALKESETSLKLAQEIGNIGNWETNLINYKSKWSENLYRIFGLNPFEVEPSFDYFKSKMHPDDLDTMEKDFQHFLNFKFNFTNECRIYLPDGNIKWIENRMIPVFQNDNLVAIKGVIIDITARKLAEESLLLQKEQIEVQNIEVEAINNDLTETNRELIVAKDKAEEMNRLKSSFLANMSHELRTPMIGIMGFSQLLEGEYYSDDVKEIGGLIHQSSQRLMETLNLILDLSRIEAGDLFLDFANIDLMEEINDVSNLHQPVAHNKNLFLNIDSDYRNYQINTDTKALRSILNNLINNAIKFTNTGGVTVSVELEKDLNHDWAVIKVTDTGIGIAKEDIVNIFTDFRQVSEGLGRNFEGTGLGLTLVKKYLALLNGTISVISKLGEGSTFVVRLPNKIDGIQSQDVQIPILQDSYDIFVDVINKQTNIHSVLLVEDDLVSTIIVKKYLQDIYELDTTGNGLKSIEMAKTKQYSVILMDINLGRGMNGLEAAKEIKKLPGYFNIPIVALTAYAMYGDAEEFLNNGCDYYISKPFEKKHLMDLLEEIVK